MKKQKEIKSKNVFFIKSIEILSFSINSKEKPLPEQLTFKFNVRLEFKTNDDLNYLYLITHIDIENVDLSIMVGQLSVSCIFQIENISKKIKIKDNHSIDIPTELLEELIEVSVSTTRGVMFSTFKGTFLHNAVLPIMDVKQFVPLNK